MEPCPARNIFPKSHKISPLLTKVVRSRWVDICLVLSFCVYTKKELGQYPAILTSHLVNNPYSLNVITSGHAIFTSQRGNIGPYAYCDTSQKSVYVGGYFILRRFPSQLFSRWRADQTPLDGPENNVAIKSIFSKSKLISS